MFPTHEVSIDVRLAGHDEAGMTYPDKRIAAHFRMPALMTDGTPLAYRVDMIERGIEQAVQAIGDQLRAHYLLPTRRQERKKQHHERRQAFSFDAYMAARTR
ncbi:hypothetical protein SEA_BANQUO_55 [Gordonia phage Banquo]|nr:hypothetical protein SEA_BANQUO_55 [Gordonia phage Banquo]